MPTEIRVHLVPGVELLDDQDGRTSLRSGATELAAVNGTAVLFRELHGRGLLLGAPDATRPGAMRRGAVLARLARLGWLSHVVYGAEGELARTLPDPSPMSAPGPTPAAPREGRLVLSRFARAELTADGLGLQTPLSDHRLVTRHPGVLALLAGMGVPFEVDELCATGPLAGDQTRAVLGLLARAGLLTRVRADGRLEEDDDVALRQWEPHDLAFHAHTRSGLDTGTTGATYRFRGEIDPLPAVSPRGSGRTVPLRAAGVRPDVAFDAVLRDRRSIRDHAERAVTLDQLGELLHRAARTTAVRRLDGEQGGEEAVSRPYPSGGALHELELYLVVDRCAGLDPGVYHYRTADHELEHVADASDATEALLRDAGYSMGTGRSPQVLVMVAARFPRLSWKYQSIAYSLVLKHVGCLVQTLYLVATSMGLASCAIGGGDAAQAAKVLPGSPYLLTSVGELSLGVPAPDARTLTDS